MREQNARLNAAINNMSHGLCMLDASERLVVYNGRYASMYGLSPEETKSGMALRDIVERRAAKGICYRDGAQDYVPEAAGIGWRD